MSLYQWKSFLVISIVLLDHCSSFISPKTDGTFLKPTSHRPHFTTYCASFRKTSALNTLQRPIAVLFAEGKGSGESEGNVDWDKEWSQFMKKRAMEDGQPSKLGTMTQDDIMDVPLIENSSVEEVEQIKNQLKEAAQGESSSEPKARSSSGSPSEWIPPSAGSGNRPNLKPFAFRREVVNGTQVSSPKGFQFEEESPRDIAWTVSSRTVGSGEVTLEERVLDFFSSGQVLLAVGCVAFVAAGSLMVGVSTGRITNVNSQLPTDPAKIEQLMPTYDVEDLRVMRPSLSNNGERMS